MSDKELKELMDLTIEAREAYSSVLNQLELEYKNRFGNYPSDVDDDFFISTFHYSQNGKITVKQLTENAKDRKRIF